MRITGTADIDGSSIKLDQGGSHTRILSNSPSGDIDLTLPSAAAGIVGATHGGDATKIVVFTSDGATTGKTLTIDTNHTDNRTWTVPDSTDTIVGKATTDTLTNKTLTSPVIATIVNNSNNLTLPTTTDTIVGRATTDTLTNKTLTSPVIATIVNSGNNLTLPTTTDTIVGRATTDTLTNKTLTSPVIATIVNSGTLTLPTSSDTMVGRATTDTLTNKTVTALTTSAGSYITMKTQSVLRLEDDSGTDYVGLDAPNSVTSWTLTLPAVAPASSSQVICSTDTAGNTVWASALTSTLASTNFFVGNGSNVSTAVAMSGDMTMANTGAVTAKTNLALTSPILTTPQIQDTSADHQYIFAVSELSADRTVTLPLLAGNDTFTFNAFAATLTNKSIDSDNNTITNIVNADIKAAAAIGLNKLAALTASEIAISDGSGFLVSAAVATYPSLAELAHGKGVTSAIQTQIDSKQGTLTNSAGLLAALNDETGTGVAVFSISPTFTGTVSAAALTLTGAFTSLGIDDNADAIAMTIDSSENVTFEKNVTVKDELTLGEAGEANGVINAADSMYFNIDSDADQSGQNFFFAHNNTGGAGTILMTISDIGKVGIGTTSPTYRFDVEASTNNDWVAEIVNTSSTAPQGLWVKMPNGTGAAAMFLCSSSTGSVLYVQGDGVIGGFATSWGSSSTQDVGFSVTSGSGQFHKFTSSRRYKKNETSTLTFDTASVYDLVPKEYDRIENGIHELGLIAEDVSEVLPCLTVYETQHVLDGEGEITPEVEYILDDDGGRIPVGVDYKMLGVVLLAEMKKLKDRITKLERPRA